MGRRNLCKIFVYAYVKSNAKSIGSILFIIIVIYYAQYFIYSINHSNFYD
jgi:hypothetical protein